MRNRGNTHTLVERPHWVFECSKRGKFAVLVMKEERYEEETSIASILLLSAIQSKVGKEVGGCMYVKTEVRGKKLQAIMNT